MDTNYTLVYLKLIEEVAQDGELNHKEIRQLAKWLNENPEGRKSWPASMFFPLLKDVFADGQIERPEAEKVGRLIQRVRREWARENSLCGSNRKPIRCRRNRWPRYVFSDRFHSAFLQLRRLQNKSSTPSRRPHLSMLRTYYAGLFTNQTRRWLA